MTPLRRPSLALRAALLAVCALPACGEEAPDREIAPTAQVRAGGDGFQSPSAVAEAGGAVVVVGSYEGAFVQGGIPLPAAGGLEGFVLGLDWKGAVRFAHAVSGDDDDAVVDVAGSPEGWSVVGGQSSRGAAWRAAGADGPTGAAFAAKLLADGRPAWVTSASGSGFQAVTAVAIAPDGAVYAGGDFSEDLAWGASSARATGGGDAFVARLSATGELEWIEVIGGPGTQRLTGLAVTEGGALAVAGLFREALHAGAARGVPSRGLSETPFVGLYGPAGEVRWIETTLVPEASASGHGHHDEAHGEQVVSQLTIGAVPGGGVMAAASHGAALGHGDGFEAPQIGTVAITRLGGDGRIVGRGRLSSAAGLVELGALHARGAAMRLVASWTGEIELPQGSLVSRDRRSLLLLDLTGGVKIEAARAFGLEGAGLTARDAVATSAGVLVTGRWQDLARDDSDVFLGLFPR